MSTATHHGRHGHRRLLRGGEVISATGRALADVLIDGERIAAVGPSLQVGDAEVVDVTDRLVMPGGVDVHTHLDTPFMGTVTADDYPSGTTAAACGGTTTLVDFAFQSPGQRLPDAVQTWHDKAAKGAAIDYGFHLAITDLYDGAIADMRPVVAAGVPSFKVFMAYKGAIMLQDGELFRVIRNAGRIGARTCVHAESGDLIDVLSQELADRGKLGPASHAESRPPLTEWEAVRRVIAIAELAEAPIYLVHLSTAEAAAAVRDARRAGQPVGAETCTHYLLLGPEEYHRPSFEGAKYVVTPPLRERPHRDALWAGLSAGDLGVVSSDHCPFCFSTQKSLGRDDFRKIPNGGPGVEHRFLLTYAHGVVDGRMTLERFVDVIATTPAKTFGLHPRKGVIQVGSDADVVVLDPAAHTIIMAATQAQDVDYTPFEKWRVPGRIDQVYSRGQLVARGGRFVGRLGHGAFLERRPVS
jgi:dihydropyrimidinase